MTAPGWLRIQCWGRISSNNPVLEMQDEQQWEIAFQRAQNKLTAAARRAKQEISAGKAEPMGYSRL